MKKAIVLLLMFPFLHCISFAQNREEAEKLVSEGVTYHDKGDYARAVSLYDKALELDKDNLLALTEKAYSLLLLQKYDASVTCCQRVIETHTVDDNVKTIYVTYGTALDGMRKPEEALKIYDAGIKRFPAFYQLHFNKGVTLANIGKNDEAISSFQKAVTLNGDHAGSHNGMARVLNTENKKIPSLLAYCRFLVIEPQSDRAKQNLTSMQEIMKGNVQKTGDKSVTINVTSDMLDIPKAGKKQKENTFNATELVLALDAALDFDDKNKDKTDVEQFIRKFETVCGSLKEGKSYNHGFYWDYYVPYFTEMKDKKLIEAFAYIAFASSDNQNVSAWLKTNADDVNKFYGWSKNYNWK